MERASRMNRLTKSAFLANSGESVLRATLPLEAELGGEKDGPHSPWPSFFSIRKSPTCETFLGFFSPSAGASLAALPGFEPRWAWVEPPGAAATTGVVAAVGLAEDVGRGVDTFVSSRRRKSITLVSAKASADF